MSKVSFHEQPYYKALTASLQQLEDPAWVTSNLFVGQPTSLNNERCLEAIRLRAMVEEMKGGASSSRLSRVANRLTLLNVVLTLVIAVSTLVNLALNWR